MWLLRCLFLILSTFIRTQFCGFAIFLLEVYFGIRQQLRDFWSYIIMTHSKKKHIVVHKGFSSELSHSQQREWRNREIENLI